MKFLRRLTAKILRTSVPLEWATTEDISRELFRRNSCHFVVIESDCKRIVAWHSGHQTPDRLGENVSWALDEITKKGFTMTVRSNEREHE